MRRLTLVALTATTLPAFTSVPAASGPATKPLVIGPTISQTESAAGTAAYVLQYQRWAGDANHHGGLLGRPVQLKVYDDASTPQTAAALYRRLVTEDKPA